MNHGKKIRKFNRMKGQRAALMKTMAVSLVEHEKITTTEAKAKSLRPYVEKLVTIAKNSETVTGRRLLSARTGPRTARKLSLTLAPRYKDRKGGYLRITKMPRRVNDGSKMAVIEFV